MKPKYPSLKVWLLGAAVLLGSVGYSVFLMNSHAGDGVPKDGSKKGTSTAKPDNMAVVCMGFVDVATRVLDVFASFAGQVTEVLVKEDQTVKEGDILFKLDERQAKLLVRQAQADLNEAKVRQKESLKLVKQHQLEIQQQNQAIIGEEQKLIALKEDATHQKKLVDSMAASQEAVVAANARVKAQEAGVTAARDKLSVIELVDPQAMIDRALADVEAKQAKVELAQLMLDECSVKSKISGKILRIFISKGTSVPAEPKFPAMQICPDTPRLVRAEIEQEFAGRVKEGQKATIQDDSRNGQTWTGKVQRIGDWYTHRRSMLQEPLQFNDVRTLECIVDLDPDQPVPRIGTRVRVMLGM